LTDTSFNGNGARRDTAFTSAFTLIAAATACAVVLVLMPRAVQPALPPLSLERADVAQQLERDRELAAHAPRSQLADELHGLYLEEGRAELGGASALVGAREQRMRMRSLSQQVFAQVGEAGVDGLRARALERYLQAFRGELTDVAEVRGLSGAFPELLQRYGVTDVGGRLLAPELTLRAAYKVRWNIVHDLPQLASLSEVERRAYTGFLALHAKAAPDVRTSMAVEFAAAHGSRSTEAVAYWLAQGGLLRSALRTYERAYEMAPSLHVRNMRLFVSREEAEP
jgi:hypothetical protein